MFKPHFGELPPYLRQRKQELEEAQRAGERVRLQPQVGPWGGAQWATCRLRFHAKAKGHACDALCAALTTAVRSVLVQGEPGVTVISGTELADLIRHLKLKWQSINEAYVRLPCVLDTPSKLRRKQVGGGGARVGCADIGWQGCSSVFFTSPEHANRYALVLGAAGDGGAAGRN